MLNQDQKTAFDIINKYAALGQYDHESNELPFGVEPGTFDHHGLISIEKNDHGEIGFYLLDTPSRRENNSCDASFNQAQSDLFRVIEEGYFKLDDLKPYNSIYKIANCL